MELWLDLLEPSAQPQTAVRASALQVLLSAMVSVPQAKTYLTSSTRTLPCLFRLLRGGASSVVLLAVNVLWMILHSNQRAVPLVRQLNGGQVLRELGARYMCPEGEESVKISMVVQQLQALIT